MLYYIIYSPICIIVHEIVTMYICLCMHVDIIEHHAGYEEAKMSATHNSGDFNCFIYQI